MYLYTWDKETHGFLFQHMAGDPLYPLRPVYYEELDSFGFNKYWQYPKSEYPLLWADGARRYLYDGELVAETSGGGLYTEPKLNIINQYLQLSPVNIDLMVEKNTVIMKGLEQSTISMIFEKWKRFRKRDVVYVAYSGGKDSIVLLDLVHRALSPDDFVVVFGDTGMELPDTYKAIEETRERYPDVKIYTAASHLKPTESWAIFGPPSRRQRWCCAVHKSAPSILALRESFDKPVSSVLAFDGVRAEESAMRSEYTDEADSYKHASQVNIRPILNWNSAEVFNYIFSHKLVLNHVYRKGFTRAGCILCPMSFGWRDYLTRMYYSSIAAPYISYIENYARDSVNNVDDIQNYIEEGGWMARMGGKNLSQAKELVTDTIVGNRFTQNISAAHRDCYLEWSKALGNLTIHGHNKGTMTFATLQTQYNVAFIDVSPESFQVTFEPIVNPYKERMELKYLRMLASKAAYCTGCRVCEADCQHGALKIINSKVSIDKKKCVHCLKCFEIEKGCLVAKSLYISKEAKPKMSYDKYKTFGMEPKWLQIYLDKGDFECKESIGRDQYPAIKVWMREAGLLKDDAITSLGQLIEHRGLTDIISWAIIWVNLAYYSAIVNWFLQNTDVGPAYSKGDLISQLVDGGKERTRENAINALFNTLKNPILGIELGQGVIDKINNKSYVRRASWKTPDPLVILYSLYHFAEAEEGRYSFTLSQLMEHEKGAGLSPSLIFGFSQSELESVLRGLSISHPQYININFSMGLDNINLSQQYTSNDILALL